MVLCQRSGQNSRTQLHQQYFACKKVSTSGERFWRFFVQKIFFYFFFTESLSTTQVIFYMQKVIQKWDLAYSFGDPSLGVQFDNTDTVLNIGVEISEFHQRVSATKIENNAFLPVVCQKWIKISKTCIKLRYIWGETSALLTRFFLIPPLLHSSHRSIIHSPLASHSLSLRYTANPVNRKKFYSIFDHLFIWNNLKFLLVFFC